MLTQFAWHSLAVKWSGHNFSRLLLMLFYGSYLSLKMGFHFFVCAASFPNNSEMSTAFVARTNRGPYSAICRPRCVNVGDADKVNSVARVREREREPVTISVQVTWKEGSISGDLVLACVIIE